MYVFLKNNMGISMKKKIHDQLIFCADQIDVVTNSAVIMNVVIKWVHCTIIVPKLEQYLIMQ